MILYLFVNKTQQDNKTQQEATRHSKQLLLLMKSKQVQAARLAGGHKGGRALLVAKRHTLPIPSREHDEMLTCIKAQQNTA
jgi:hypothetical protein